jgi:hypothetical protein
MNLDERRVLFTTPRRDAKTVEAFAQDLTQYNRSPTTQIE